MKVYSILFILPAFVILILFRLVPILLAGRMSLFDVNLIARTELFIGFDNYIKMLSDGNFINSLKITFLFIILKVPATIVLSLSLAILVNRRQFGIGIIRSAPLMAVVIPMSIASVLWQMMYHPTNGLINSMIRSLNFPSQPFLESPQQALPAIVIMMLWKDVGFFMIFFLAGLQNIPKEYYEAARVDGATPWAEFWHITLPSLRRTTIVVLICSTVFSFQVFDPAYIMTAGGPTKSTNVIVYYLYILAFRMMRMGYATAVSIATLVIILFISALQLRASRER